MSTQSAKTKLNELKERIIDGPSSNNNSSASLLYDGIEATLINKRKGFKLQRTLKGIYGKVYALDWSNDPDLMIHVSQEGKLILWNARLGQKIYSLSLFTAWVLTCSIEKQTNQLVAYSGIDNICYIFRVGDKGSKPEKALAGHEGYIACCDFVGTSRMLTASGDGTVCLWDIERECQLVKFEGHKGDICDLELFPNDVNLFMSGSSDAKSKLWDMRTKTRVQTFSGHELDVNSISFHSNGNEFATGSDDATCRLWDIRSFSEIGKIQHTSLMNEVKAIDHSKSGRLLFYSLDDSTFHAWDTINPQEQLIVASGKHGNRVSCLGVNSKGDMLATGSWDTRINIWS